MRRFASGGFALALLAALVVAIGFLVEDSQAELENQVFTSRPDRLRMVVPRGWRATDQPSYPGLLLWMMRAQPPGTIVLTAEAFTRELYCSWSVPCRNQPTNTAKYACALRERLAEQKMHVGPTQLGPKENEAAGLASLWFEYDDGKRFLRHAIAMTNERAISLVLSAPTNDARATHVRPFDQALRTLKILTAAEAVPVGEPDAAILEAGPAVDATTLPADGAPMDAGVVFASTPVPKQSPIGPCPR
ncbi:MAG: hypothetical protein ABI867_04400 [Kofleriaceae bacterium]